jgi:hypothetical protein
MNFCQWARICLIGPGVNLVSGFQISARPPAKKTAGQIEKETEVSYEMSDVRGQKADIRGQSKKDRCQKTEDRCQRPEDPSSPDGCVVARPSPPGGFAAAGKGQRVAGFASRGEIYGFGRAETSFMYYFSDGVIAALRFFSARAS